VWSFTDLYNLNSDAVGATPEGGVTVTQDGTILGATPGAFAPPSVFSGKLGKRGWNFEAIWWADQR
jgi:hypothetical protein